MVIRRAFLLSMVLLLGILTAFGASSTAQPQPRQGGQFRTPAPSGQTWAIIIGIDRYLHAGSLTHAVADARATERALLDTGVWPEHLRMFLDGQATRVAIQRALEDVGRRVGRDDRVFVFFSGHARTMNLPGAGGQEGYLLPVDAEPTQLGATAMSMTLLRQVALGLPARQIFYVVDACYSGYPLFNRAPDRDHLDELGRRRVIQLLTAGRNGDTLGLRAGLSLFAQALVRGLQGDAFASHDVLTLEELGQWIRNRVVVESNGAQVPQYGSLFGEGQVLFHRPSPVAVVTPPPPPVVARPVPPAPEAPGVIRITSPLPGVEVFLGGQKIGETSVGQALTVNVPAGRHQFSGRKPGHRDWQREVQVAAGGTAEINIEPLREPPAVTTADDAGAMVLVPAGPFLMGSRKDDLEQALAECRRLGGLESVCRNDYLHEFPQRQVTLDAFHIDRYEVTNALYARFLAANGKGSPGPATPNHPVTGVTWRDADAYCKWAGKRLPTEAEWEKAARGADGRKFPWGSQWEKGRANGDGARGEPAPVGSYPQGASPFGVHDVGGNVWEWVADWHGHDYYERGPRQNPRGPSEGDRKVLRGGSFVDKVLQLRTTVRLAYRPEETDGNVGFRCAKSP